MKRKQTPTYQVDPISGDVFVNPRMGFLRRDTPEAPRLQAFEQARIELAIAAEFFECHGDNGTKGTEMALAAVLDYFTSRGVPFATLTPILNCLGALSDAKDGVQNATFQVAKRTGRPRKECRELEFEGIIAVIAECCIQHFRMLGARPYHEPGCRMAVKLINAAPWRRKYDVTQVREIRERVRRADAGAGDRQQYDIQMSADAAKQYPLQYAKMLVSHDWVISP